MVAALAAREACLLSAHQSAKECLKCCIQQRQQILQHMRVDGRVSRERDADILQLRFLLLARVGDAHLREGDDVLLKRCVVASPAQAKDAPKLPLRSGVSLYLNVLRRILRSIGVYSA